MTSQPSLTHELSDLDGILSPFEMESVDISDRSAVASPPPSLQFKTRGTTEHAQQGSLWRTSDVFALSVAAKLREHGRFDLCEPLEICHKDPTYLRCTGCKAVAVRWNRCDLFFCARCQPRLARERSESVEWWTREVNQPKHAVLTLKNTEWLTPEHVRHMLKSFVRLRRSAFARKVTYWWHERETDVITKIRRWAEQTDTGHCIISKPWRGGFFRLEVTNESKGWHLHLHSLIDSDFIDARVLAIEWNRCNRGTGHIVKVKDARDHEYLKEVTKYAVKGSELAKWTGAEIAQFVDSFKGFRTFGVFGSLYGKRSVYKEWLKGLEHKRGACACGCEEFRACSAAEIEWLTETEGARPPPKPKAVVIDSQFGLGFASTSALRAIKR